MKRITILLSVFFFLAVLLSSAQDTTLTYRFNHFRVTDGPVKDTLIFDVEVKANVTGTFLWGSQVVFIFNSTAFGTYIASTTTITKLGLIASYNYTVLIADNSGGTKLLINIYKGPAVDTSSLVNVPVSYTGLINVRMLIINNTQNTGVQFDASLMDPPRQKYVLPVHQGSISAGIPYDQVIYANNLINVPSTPTVFNLMFSEIGDPSNSIARFVEIYNPGSYDVNFAAYPWYLTTETNGSGSYNSVQLTGAIPAGGTYLSSVSSLVSTKQ